MIFEVYKKKFIAGLCTLYETDEAKNIAGWAIEHILKWDKTKQFVESKTELSAAQLAMLSAIESRLLQNEPIQYIVGTIDFFGVTLSVNRHTLIPRPETEELVEWIRKEHILKKKLSILDIGTGSGCIAVSLAKNLPDATVCAIDISEAAINTAKENAEKNNVNINFLAVDFLREKIGGQYDIVVSNPPYIGWDEKEKMRKNVLDYEPFSALFAEDPLIFYKKIASDIPLLLPSEGYIYLELNEHYAYETEALFYPFKTTIKKDMYGKNRMLKVEVGTVRL